MTRRAVFTEAELARAIRAADKAGKVALQTRAGIAFVDPGTIPHDLPDDSGGNTCDDIFGTGERPCD